MPKTQSSSPQWSVKNSAPGCLTWSAKMKYQVWMPLRKTPEVRSTQRDEQHQLAGENLLQQVERGKFDVHLAGRGVVRVEVRKAGVFRRVLDEPQVEQHPEQS